MPRIPNRSEDLAPGSERARKSRGTDQVTKAERGEVLIPDPDPEWHPSARMVWDSALGSGVSDFYASTDFATLHVTCTGLDHWLKQGSRKSPELLRVLLQSLGVLLFTEGDRRRLRVELADGGDEEASILASVESLFEASDH